MVWTLLRDAEGSRNERVSSRVNRFLRLPEELVISAFPVDA
jgi:hypothetical protein